MPNFFTSNLDPNDIRPVLTLESLKVGLKRMAEIEKIQRENGEEVTAIVVNPRFIVLSPYHPHNFHIYHKHCMVCKYLRKQGRKQARLRHK